MLIQCYLANRRNNDEMFVNQIEVQAWCLSQLLPLIDRPVEPAVAQWLALQLLPLSF